MVFWDNAKSKIQIRYVGALSVAAMLTLGTGPGAQAQGSQTIAPAQTQSASAHSFDMPLGSVVSPSTEPPTAFGPRIPIGDAELNRIKMQSATQAPTAAVVPPAKAKAGAINSVQTSCQTNSANGYTPSDIHGAVGTNNLVVVTNVLIGIYAKSTCNSISSTTLKTFFGAGWTIPATQTLFDPQIVYSAAADRFILTAESEDSGNTDQYQYLAVSKDNTGTSWWLYRITLSQGTGTPFCKQLYSGFWDYPHLGGTHNSVNHAYDRFYITANDFPSGVVTDAPVPADAGAILSITAHPAFSGGTITFSCFNALAFNIAAPKSPDDTTAAYFLSTGSGSGNSLTRYRLNISASGPGSDTITTTTPISISSWTAAPNPAQPNGQTVDSLDGRFQSNTIQRDGMLWNVHAIDVGGYARWRLYEISFTGTSPAFTFTPTTSQFANVDHLFNPSVAVNSTNAFVTSSRTAPSGSTAGYVAMLIFNGARDSSSGWAYDLVATSASQYQYATGTTTCNNWSPRYTCRWGDYSATQIDPSDGSTAWGFNQLITGTSQFDWTTRAALVGESVTQAALSVTPTSQLKFYGPPGGEFFSDTYAVNGSPQFTLKNTGGTSLNYSISLPSWLIVSSASGSLAAGASTTVNVLPGPLAVSASLGNYSSTITFTNTTNGSGNTNVVAGLQVFPDIGGPPTMEVNDSASPAQSGAALPAMQ